MSPRERLCGRALGVLLLIAGLAAGAYPVIALQRVGYRTPTSAGVLPTAAAVRTVPGDQAVGRDLETTSVAPIARPPDRLVVPRLAIDAGVVPVGVSQSGELVVPDDPQTLGWWTGSQPLWNSYGSVVIVGHVDSAILGRGAFYYLEKALPGDVVRVSASGRTYDYGVVARKVYVKSDLPASVFGADGPPYLVLITCGGPFDARTRHYRDNVVVYALPRR